MMSQPIYLILSLKWSVTSENLVWWRPNNSGYTVLIERAGHYSREEVEAHPSYYNNGDTTIAVPLSLAVGMSHRIVLNNEAGLAAMKHGALVPNPECISDGTDGKPAPDQPPSPPVTPSKTASPPLTPLEQGAEVSKRLKVSGSVPSPTTDSGGAGLGENRVAQATGAGCILDGTDGSGVPS
jgi:hypothetical protein